MVTAVCGSQPDHKSGAKTQSKPQFVQEMSQPIVLFDGRCTPLRAKVAPAYSVRQQQQDAEAVTFAVKRQREPEDEIEEEDPFDFEEVTVKEEEYQASGMRKLATPRASGVVADAADALRGANAGADNTPMRSVSFASAATQEQAPYNGDIPIRDIEEFRRIVRMRKQLDRRIREFLGDTECPLCGRH